MLVITKVNVLQSVYPAETKLLRVKRTRLNMCKLVPDRIIIWKCWFSGVREKWSTQKKNSRSRGENQQQTQLTYT